MADAGQTTGNEPSAGRGRLAQLIATRGGTAAPEAPFVIEHREALIARVDGIETAVNRLKMPLAYADQFYVLREHIGFVRDRLTHGGDHPVEEARPSVQAESPQDLAAPDEPSTTTHHAA